MDTRFAITEYHDAAEVTRQLDNLIKQPIYTIKPDVLKKYDFDFLTGSVHWIDGWGFDHKGQKETWESKNTEEIYKRYYYISYYASTSY